MYYTVAIVLFSIDNTFLAFQALKLCEPGELNRSALLRYFEFTELDFEGWTIAR